MINEHGTEILKVDCCKGKVHDFELFKQSQLLIHPNTEIIVDLGYQGITKIHSNSKIPYKSSKKNKLTKEQKKFNRQHSKRRIPVEHLIRKCKIFNIVKHTYRGKHKNYGLSLEYSGWAG